MSEFNIMDVAQKTIYIEDLTRITRIVFPIDQYELVTIEFGFVVDKLEHVDGVNPDWYVKDGHTFIIFDSGVIEISQAGQEQLWLTIGEDQHLVELIMPQIKNTISKSEWEGIHNLKTYGRPKARPATHYLNMYVQDEKGYHPAFIGLRQGQYGGEYRNLYIFSDVANKPKSLFMLNKTPTVSGDKVKTLTTSVPRGLPQFNNETAKTLSYTKLDDLTFRENNIHIANETINIPGAPRKNAEIHFFGKASVASLANVVGVDTFNLIAKPFEIGEHVYGK